MVARFDLGAIREKVDRCEVLVADLEVLEAARSADSMAKASFTTWNTGEEIIPKLLLRKVIDAGVAAVICQLQAELESINLTSSDAQ